MHPKVFDCIWNVTVLNMHETTLQTKNHVLIKEQTVNKYDTLYVLIYRFCVCAFKKNRP